MYSTSRVYYGGILSVSRSVDQSIRLNKQFGLYRRRIPYPGGMKW
jgi:hypothetical protein